MKVTLLVLIFTGVCLAQPLLSKTNKVLGDNSKNRNTSQLVSKSNTPPSSKEVHWSKRYKISDNKINRLKTEKFYDKMDNSISSCGNTGHSNPYLFGMMADNVIIGTITDIKYLYKEGAAYRTKYTINVSSTIKGEPSETINIYSRVGPNTRDHRRWIHSSPDIGFEIGDRGLIFIVKNKDKLNFLGGEIKGIYLITDNGFNKEYLKHSQKEESLDLDGLLDELQDIVSIISEED